MIGLMESIEEAVRRAVRDEVAKCLANETVKVERQVIVIDPRRLYSVRSVAELLEVSTAYIYDRINRGEITVVELGNEKAKQRISVPELEQFIEVRTFGGTSR